MEFSVGPSIDAILSSQASDYEDVQSLVRIPHQVRSTSSTTRRRHPLSPKTPDTPDYYDGLGSHRMSDGETQTKELSKLEDQLSLSMLSHDVHISRPAYHTLPPQRNDSSEYATDESFEPLTASESWTESASMLTPPSLVSTPTTPPTPSAPLLPTFPDLGAAGSIYRHIPFSPVVPSFSDCPFRYYRDDVPRSKSHNECKFSLQTRRSEMRPVLTLQSTMPRRSEQKVQARDEVIVIDLQEDAETFPLNPIHSSVDDADVDINVDINVDDDMTGQHLQKHQHGDPLQSKLDSRKKAWSMGQKMIIDADPKRWSQQLSLQAQMQELESMYHDLKRSQRQSMEQSTLPTFAIHMSAY